MQAAISAITYHLPEDTLTNAKLAAEFPDWTIDKIEQKTGIAVRHIASAKECSSDLAVSAAHKLFSTTPWRPEQVDFLLFCTQSPDYFLPTTACILQDRLGLSTRVGALDFNLGCSGYIYGLSLAKGLIETGQARTVLLLTGETYSKFVHPADRSVRCIFGDAASATMLCEHDASTDGCPWVGPFVFGSDGRGAINLIVPAGGLREPRHSDTSQAFLDEHGNSRSRDTLYMNGPEIFTFTLRTVPQAINKLLELSGKRHDDIDFFVFHQANEYMLEHLRRKAGIPKEKFLVSLREFGNTVSSTIPIALYEAAAAGQIKPGACLMLVGFGVGYSWGATLVRWAAETSHGR